jgi:DNA gyrase inhibitor GyrI
MDQPDVRVVEFAPMWVATCRRVGERAATRALETLIIWAGARNLLAAAKDPRFFGFGDPLPGEDDPAHAFEAWMTVGGDAPAGDAPGSRTPGDPTVKLQQAPGGLYAVTSATPEEFASGAAWERFEARLAPWMAENGYRYDETRQWLEAYIPDPGQVARLPELCAESRWVAFDLCIPIEPATGTSRKNNLRNLVALVLTIALFAFATGTFAGLEARRGPDWYLELQTYIAESALQSETTRIVSVAEAMEPANFSPGMGIPRHDAWRRVPPHAAKCVLLERNRPLTPSGEPVPRRQIVFLVYHSDALYRVGWLAYAGPWEPFGTEARTQLRALGCALDLE